jgi:hypothetical protein
MGLFSEDKMAKAARQQPTAIACAAIMTAVA